MDPFHASCGDHRHKGRAVVVTDWTPQELENAETLRELREEAWNLVFLLELEGKPWRYWDSTLRDLEDNYVEIHAWREAVSSMQALRERDRR